MKHLSYSKLTNPNQGDLASSTTDFSTPHQVVYTEAATGTPLPTYLAQAESSPLVSFLPIVFILLIFYFLLIRPQSKKQKAIEKKRKLVEKGDKIITTSGMYVKVVDLDKEKDLMTITPDGQVKIEMTITAIAEVLVTDEVFKKREDKDKEKGKK